MKEVPQHLQGLLRFCLEAGNEYPAGGIEPMDQERINWLREALNQTTVDIFGEMKKRIGAVIQNMYDGDKQQETIENLEDIIDYTEDINLADVFLKMGGLELIKEILGKPVDMYIAYAGMILSNVMQNHNAAQQIAINDGLLETALNLLQKDGNAIKSNGLLSGISSLTRGCKEAIEKFLQLNGFDIIFKVLEDVPSENDYTRFIEKGAFFLYCISQELSADQRRNLQSSNITDRLASLILKFNVPREFLVRALTYFLVGKICILNDPEAEDPDELVTLPISPESAARLKKWANSKHVISHLDEDARESLLKALQ